jgi:hypothetical protein
LSPKWKGFAGPAIQLSVSNGDTFGRFEVAKTIARVFPDYSDFVRRVMSEGVEPANSFPSGPFRTDKLIRRSKNVIEFQTPPNARGLGTESRLIQNDAPISGVAVLFGPEPNLMKLSLRLPPEFDHLVKAVIQQAEADAAKATTSN